MDWQRMKPSGTSGCLQIDIVLQLQHKYNINYIKWSRKGCIKARSTEASFPPLTLNRLLHCSCSYLVKKSRQFSRLGSITSWVNHELTGLGFWHTYGKQVLWKKFKAKQLWKLIMGLLWEILWAHRLQSVMTYNAGFSCVNDIFILSVTLCKIDWNFLFI